MTKKQQRRFFFPAWSAVCRALGWRMVAGRLELGGGRAANEHRSRVIAAATAIAAKEHRAPTLDDLRHGCYVVALGCDRDTLKLNNREVDAVTSLFKLLVDETNIAADLRLSNPDIGERERLVRAIIRLRVPDALIDEVCRHSFAPVYSAPFHEDLPLPNLRALVGILTKMSERQRSVFRSALPPRCRGEQPTIKL